MTDSNPAPPADQVQASLAGLRGRQRRPVHVQQSDLVEEGPLLADRPFPHLVRPAARVGPMDLPSYCDGARELLMARLRQHGAVLLRGFAVGGVAGFETALRRLFGELLDYSYRSTPRSLVASRIYTSTEYPADRAIPLHNEMSYTRSWPRKIGFFCMLPAEQGGATPIADSRGVLRRLSPQVRERFRAQGVLYVRNYGKHLDLPWQDVFQTGDPAEVERLCRHLGLDFTWGEDGRLRTRQVCQAVALHPDTGEEVWFNQAHLFHVSSLGEELAAMLLAAASEDDLPRNTCFGDGSAIAPAALAEIRAAFAAETIVFPWQQDDVLLLDNMLIAHGREPYRGARRVVVGMAEPWPADRA
ncbi:MAG TPA: TauD/TfdA family dioxygenase [Thermoanaerobaculia bacterium]|nr:TauD/TfdA family dioxygenase [Thermoanaerobaculia bacterium]